MGIRWTGVAALAAVAIFAGSRASADDPATSDLRCLIAIGSASGAGDVSEDLKPLLLFGSMFYLGKLEGRAPDLDLENRIADEAQNMTADDMKNDLVRCADELRTESVEMKSIAGRLTARAQALTPPPSDQPNDTPPPQ